MTVCTWSCLEVQLDPVAPKLGSALALALHDLSAEEAPRVHEVPYSLTHLSSSHSEQMTQLLCALSLLCKMGTIMSSIIVDIMYERGLC